MTKYHSKKVVMNGETFDSRKEYRRYCELVLLVKAGEITDLQRQVEFELIPAQWESFERYSEKTGKQLKDGQRCIERAVVYVADFVYNKDGKQIVEDVKGYTNSTAYDVFVIKRKLMLQLHGIKIHEV